MREKTTSELDELLKNMKPKQLTDYYKENRSYMVEQRTFSYHMKNTFNSKNIRLKDVYVAVGVTESWGSKILSMEKHTTNRDLIIRFCIAGHFSIDETNKALILYGMNSLYARNERDACLIMMIHNRIFDFYEIDTILEEHNLKKLTEK